MRIEVNNKDLQRMSKHPSFRLKIFRSRIKRTQSSFADAIGIMQPYYSKLESGKIEPSISTLITIQEVFDMSLNWYATGRGNMFCEEEEYDSSFDDQEVIPINLSLPNIDKSENNVHLNSVKFPKKATNNILVPVPAYGGYLHDWTQDFVSQELVYIDVPGQPRDARTFVVDGESMEPVLYSGDYVVCSRIERLEYVKSGYIHVVISHLEGITVKYVHDSKDVFILEPANRIDHIPTTIHKSDIKELWLVVQRITKEIIQPIQLLYKPKESPQNNNSNSV